MAATRGAYSYQPELEDLLEKMVFGSVRCRMSLLEQINYGIIQTDSGLQGVR